MSNFNHLSRRRFIATASATALSSVLLKACGNPPEDKPTITSANVARINLPADQVPETTKVKLGFLPIGVSATLIIAQEKGCCAKYCMTDVAISM
ncbi:MAG: bicarbonate-binding protein, partial [Pseudanabaena sp.]